MGTVLVVEDDRDIREVLRRYLERAGHSVLSTASGMEALRLLAGGAVDLVLLDLGLPDLDGLEILREARTGRHTPVLVLTARSAVDDRIAGLTQGADDYVTKPFSPTEVVLRVGAVLSRANPSGVPGGGDGPVAPTYGGGRLRIDADRREAFLDGGPARPDRHRVGPVDHPGVRSGASVLPLRAGQPRSRVRVRRVRAQYRLPREEPAAQARPSRCHDRRYRDRGRLPARSAP